MNRRTAQVGIIGLLLLVLTLHVAGAQPPELTYSLSPSAGPFVPQTEVNINVNCTAGASYTIAIEPPNTTATTLSTGTCNTTTIIEEYTPTTIGEYQFQLSAKNTTDNNVTSKEVTFTVKELTVAITSDSNYGYVTVDKDFEAHSNTDDSDIEFRWIIKKNEEEIYRTTSGSKLSYLFTDTGYYQVFVEAEDSYGNLALDVFNTTIKAPAKVWFIVRNQATNEPIEDALIEVSGQEKQTDSLGGSLFFLEKTAHVVSVAKDDYYTFKQYVDVDQDKTVSIDMVPYTVDEENPELDILSLDEVGISSADDASLDFIVYDESSTTCDIYLKKYESYKWKMMKTFSDIITYKTDPRNIQKSYLFEDLVDGSRYDWKIICIDTYGNKLERLGYFELNMESGQTSAATSTPKAADNDLTEEEETLQKKFDNTRVTIEKALDNVKTLDADEKIGANIFEYTSKVNTKDKEFIDLNRRYSETKEDGELSADDKKKIYTEILLELRKLEQVLPIDITVDAKKDDVMSSPDSSGPLLNIYATTMLGDDTKDFVKTFTEYPPITATVVAGNVKVTYADFSEQEFSFFQATGFSKKLTHLIGLPKTIKKENILTLYQGELVDGLALIKTKEDTVQGLIAAKSLSPKDISLAVFVESESSSKITGNVAAGLSGIRFTKTSLLGILLFVLIGAYVFMNVDINFGPFKSHVQRLTSMIQKEKDPELLRLFEKVELLKIHIREMNINQAHEVYGEINGIYRMLSYEQKVKANDKTKTLFNELMLANASYLLDLISEHINAHHLDLAKEQYDSFKIIYEHLPTDEQRKIKLRSVAAHMELEKLEEIHRNA